MSLTEAISKTHDGSERLDFIRGIVVLTQGLNPTFDELSQ